MATANTKNKNKLNARKVAPKAAPKSVASAGPTEAQVYTMAGKKGEMISLPAALFALPWRASLVQQVALAMEANARPVVANTKNRGEVRGGGRKPWKQKGTGRARHGSSRSPIWKGGGVTFGPRAERSYTEKINKKMRINALLTVLSKKSKDGEVLFVDSLSFGKPSTKEAKGALEAIAKAAGAERLVTKGRNSAVIAFASKNEMSEKSFRNLGQFSLEEVRNLNPVSLLKHKYLIIENPAEAFKTLTARAAK
jgi:large subunit ribosomal protein L4